MFPPKKSRSKNSLAGEDARRASNSNFETKSLQKTDKSKGTVSEISGCNTFTQVHKTADTEGINRDPEKNLKKEKISSVVKENSENGCPRTAGVSADCFGPTTEGSGLKTIVGHFSVPSTSTLRFFSEHSGDVPQAGSGDSSGLPRLIVDDDNWGKVAGHQDTLPTDVLMECDGNKLEEDQSMMGNAPMNDSPVSDVGNRSNIPNGKKWIPRESGTKMQNTADETSKSAMSKEENLMDEEGKWEEVQRRKGKNVMHQKSENYGKILSSGIHHAAETRK